MDNLVKCSDLALFGTKSGCLNNSQLSCKYLCGYTFLFFYDFLMYSLIFMNMKIRSLAYFTAE